MRRHGRDTQFRHRLRFRRRLTRMALIRHLYESGIAPVTLKQRILLSVGWLVLFVSGKVFLDLTVTPVDVYSLGVVD